MTTTLKTLMTRLKLKRTAAAAAAAVVARAPSPQANERRMAKETQAETATYREQGIINKNTCCLSLQHGVVALPGLCIMIAFVSCIICGASSRNGGVPSRSMLDIFTYPADFRQVEIFYG